MNAATLPETFQPNNHSKSAIEYGPVQKETEDELRKILKDHYAIAGVKSIEQVKELEMNSNNFKIVHDGGKVLLRKNISNNAADKVMLEHRLLEYCNQHSLKVPNAILTKNGNIFAEHGGALYTAYTFLEGNHYAGSIKELREAAEEIAKLHIALRDLPFKEDIGKKFSMLTNSYDLGLLSRLHESAKDGTDFGRLLLDNHAFIERNTKEVLKKLPELNKNLQIIHGDLHPHNFIFGNESLRSILDFGEMREGPLLEDIAYSAYRLIRQYVVNNSISGAKLKDAISEAMSVYLENYTKHNSVSKSDTELISTMIKHIALKKVFFILSKNYLEMNTKWNFDLPKHINSLREAEYFERS